MTEWMGGEGFIWAWMGLALLSAISLVFIDAPYGRHVRAGWGPSIPSRLGWVVMETPSLLIMGSLFVSGGRFDDVALWTFAGMWCAHYVHRSWIYPFRARITGKTMPLSIAAMAVLFNGVNATLNGDHLFHLAAVPGPEWLLDPRFGLGVAVFVLGMIINIHSDNLLLGLRKGTDGGYVIPRGGLFRWVSSPNYLGEMLEWIGFALATWSLAGLAFAVWTIANLLPRAISNHRWYRTQFPDYPPERRRLIPGIF